MITDVVYHGTVHAFALRDMQKIAYFTTNLEFAEWFMEHQPLVRGGYPRIINARIDAKHVYHIDWNYKLWNHGSFPDEQLFDDYMDFVAERGEDEKAYWETAGMSVDMLAEMMEDSGYDLVICSNVVEENGMIGDIYAVLKNAKLISASA